MKPFHALTLILAMLLGTAYATDESGVDWSFKWPKAKAAKTKYDLRTKKALDQFNATVERAQAQLVTEARAARLDLIQALDEAVREVTKSGNLDEAIKIRNAKEKLEKDTGDANAPTNDSVPAAATRYGKHSYLVIHINGISWQRARELCRKMGGDLAVVETRDELDFLHRLCGKRNVWIGAQKAGDHWKWIDGRTVDQTFWHPGTPFPEKGTDLFVYLNELGAIANATISHENIPGFICEWPFESKNAQ